MTKFYDFKNEVISDVKDYLASHTEINPFDSFNAACMTLDCEFGASDEDSNKMVKDTIYEVLNEWINDIDDETYEKLYGKKKR